MHARAGANYLCERRAVCPPRSSCSNRMVLHHPDAALESKMEAMYIQQEMEAELAAELAEEYPDGS